MQRKDKLVKNTEIYMDNRDILKSIHYLTNDGTRGLGKGLRKSKKPAFEKS